MAVISSERQKKRSFYFFEKNIGSPQNYKSRKRGKFLHNEKNQTHPKLILMRLIFLIFWFSRFLCKFIILRNKNFHSKCWSSFHPLPWHTEAFASSTSSDICHTDWCRVNQQDVQTNRCMYGQMFGQMYGQIVGSTGGYTMVENRKKHRQNSHSIIHCPTSEEVSEVSERANEWAQRSARVKRAGRRKRTREWCERTSERTSEWSSITVCILGCYRP